MDTKLKTTIDAITIIVILLLTVVFSFDVYIIPDIDQSNKITEKFGESTVNISKENYSIAYYNNHFGTTWRYYRDSTWCYWNITVSLKDYPFINTECVLWLNVETDECYYSGILPKMEE